MILNEIVKLNPHGSVQIHFFLYLCFYDKKFDIMALEHDENHVKFIISVERSRGGVSCHLNEPMWSPGGVSNGPQNKNIDKSTFFMLQKAID